MINVRPLIYTHAIPEGSIRMTTKRMQGAYDAIAAQYAVINAAMPQALMNAAARFLTLAGPSARVLDVGCGAGRDMAWFERHGVPVTGIDLSRGMLLQARSQVQGQLLQMDMRRLAFRAASYDGVWCSASLLHLPKDEVPTTLAEFGRVLRPKGVLFLAVQEGTGEQWERGPYGAVDRLFARYSPAEMTTLLSGGGFTVHEQASDEAGTRRWLQFVATT